MKRTTHAVVPLVMVTVLPAMEHPPVVVIMTASPELAVAATGNALAYGAEAGGGVPTVIVWSALLPIVKLWVTEGAGL